MAMGMLCRERVVLGEAGEGKRDVGRNKKEDGGGM